MEHLKIKKVTGSAQAIKVVSVKDLINAIPCVKYARHEFPIRFKILSFMVISFLKPMDFCGNRTWIFKSVLPITKGFDKEKYIDDIMAKSIELDIKVPSEGLREEIRSELKGLIIITPNLYMSFHDIDFKSDVQEKFTVDLFSDIENDTNEKIMLIKANEQFIRKTWIIIACFLGLRDEHSTELRISGYNILKNASKLIGDKIVLNGHSFDGKQMSKKYQSDIGLKFGDVVIRTKNTEQIIMVDDEIFEWKKPINLQWYKTEWLFVPDGWDYITVDNLISHRENQDEFLMSNEPDQLAYNENLLVKYKNPDPPNLLKADLEVLMSKHHMGVNELMETMRSLYKD